MTKSICRVWMVVLVMLALGVVGAGAQVRGEQQVRIDTFEFRFEGRKYVGLLNEPIDAKPTGLIVMLPGSGQTDVVRANAYRNTRRHFNDAGLATFLWDKAGCGLSEGVFDYDQSIENSAAEAVAAVAALRAQHVAGAERIGVWGISRAGWIAPLVVAKTPIAFWISVSGTDDKESFGYLLEKNFLIEGRSAQQTAMLVSEWKRGMEVARSGGSFEENLHATEHLRNDSFYRFLTNNSTPTREGYTNWQKKIAAGELHYDAATGLPIYVMGFDSILSQVRCPVLAIFGEKDTQVNWQKTRALYQRTIGANPEASLTMKVFPDCNHNMMQCKTGGYNEDLSDAVICPGYFDTMTSWLKEQGFGR